jgi:purine-binding chemotaxis protein CheW
MEDTAFKSHETLEMISFDIVGQTFCIDIRFVLEIRGWTPATHMPQTPDFMLGVINLRGSVIPVLDLRCRLGLGVTEPSGRHVIVVIKDDDRMAGLLVDAVQETFQVDSAALQEPPELATKTSFRFVDAIIPFDGALLSRLVVASLLPRPSQLAA